MGAYHKDKVGFSEPGWKLTHEIDHGFMARVAEDGQRTPAMGKVDYLSCFS
jgi:hypothetical protein